MGTITEKLSYLTETKNAIKTALINKGVELAQEDSFRSYADKISKINNEAPIPVKALLPDTYSGSTNAKEKVLLNPVSYYNNQKASFSYTPLYSSNYHNFFSSSNFITFSQRDFYSYIFGLDENKDMKLIESEYDIPNSAPFCMFDDFYIFPLGNNFCKFFFDEETQTMQEKSFSIGLYNAHHYSTYYYKDERYLNSSLLIDNLIYIPIHAGNYEIFLCCIDLRSLTGTAAHFQEACVTQKKPVALYKCDSGIYFLDGDWNISSDGNSKAVWQDKPEDLADVNASIQLLTGKRVFIIDTVDKIRVLKPTETDLGITWVEVTSETTLINDTIGSVLPSGNFFYQADFENLYVLNNNKLYAFHYSEQNDTITVIDHPCNGLMTPEEPQIPVHFNVNYAAGTYALLLRTVEEASNYEIRYAHKNQIDTGDLNWVAYKVDKNNFTPQSMVAYTTGTTGTDENGNSYLMASFYEPHYGIDDAIGGINQLQGGDETAE